jgi:hypothetical protein
MSLLNRLPEIYYGIGSKPLDPDYILIRNIWRRAEILKEYKSSVSLFAESIVGDGERPEDMATKLYRNPFYNWTILVINDIVDYYAQWPKSEVQLQQFINDKYDNPMATRDYVTTEVKDANENIIVPAGKVVPQTFQVAYFNGSTTVTSNPVASRTYAQYEYELNAEKQKIQVVKPELIEDFVGNYIKLINRGKNDIAVTSGADIKMN